TSPTLHSHLSTTLHLPTYSPDKPTRPWPASTLRQPQSRAVDEPGPPESAHDPPAKHASPPATLSTIRRIAPAKFRSAMRRRFPIPPCRRSPKRFPPFASREPAGCCKLRRIQFQPALQTGQPRALPSPRAG